MASRPRACLLLLLAACVALCSVRGGCAISAGKSLTSAASAAQTHLHRALRARRGKHGAHASDGWVTPVEPPLGVQGEVESEFMYDDGEPAATRTVAATVSGGAGSLGGRATAVYVLNGDDNDESTPTVGVALASSRRNGRLAKGKYTTVSRGNASAFGDSIVRMRNGEDEGQGQDQGGEDGRPAISATPTVVRPKELTGLGGVVLNGGDCVTALFPCEAVDGDDDEDNDDNITTTVAPAAARPTTTRAVDVESMTVSLTAILAELDATLSLLASSTAGAPTEAAAKKTAAVAVAAASSIVEVAANGAGEDLRQQLVGKVEARARDVHAAVAARLAEATAERQRSERKDMVSQVHLRQVLLSQQAGEQPKSSGRQNSGGGGGGGSDGNSTADGSSSSSSSSCSDARATEEAYAKLQRLVKELEEAKLKRVADARRFEQLASDAAAAQHAEFMRQLRTQLATSFKAGVDAGGKAEQSRFLELLQRKLGASAAAAAEVVRQELGHETQRQAAEAAVLRAEKASLAKTADEVGTTLDGVAADLQHLAAGVQRNEEARAARQQEVLRGLRDAAVQAMEDQEGIVRRARAEVAQSIGALKPVVVDLLRSYAVSSFDT